MNESINNTGRSGLTRREAVQAGLLVPCLALPALRASAAPPRKATAKSVIQIWLWGGPAHTDTFDPKPEAGSDYTGPFERPIPTNVDGIRVGELMVEMAKIADKYAVKIGRAHV